MKSTISYSQNQHIVEIAKSWVGTPYRHQGDQKHIGCDCLGLIRGVWREVYDSEPERPNPYAKDWAEQGGDERMLEAARRHFGPEIPVSEMHEGSLILFRWRQGTAIKHAGIVSGPSHFIHAYERICVTQSPLVPSWKRRIAAVFKFPII
jgi:NlpC/P60 family putative phage cell wall peptidase